MRAAEGERYTIRRQVFRFFGAGFHIYDPSGGLVGYGNQKAFRLREDLRVFTDESKTEELLRIGTQQVIDFGATYTVSVPGDDGGDLPIGSLRRKGLKSMLRDEWIITGTDGTSTATIREDSAWKAVLRRVHDLVGLLIPQSYHVTDDAGTVARYRTHANPFVHRLGVSVERDDAVFDDLLLLAGGILLLAIEGRQD